MLGKLVVDGTPEETVPFDNPDERNLVQEVSIKVVQPDNQNDGLALWPRSLNWHVQFILMLVKTVSLALVSRNPEFSTPAEV